MRYPQLIMGLEVDQFNVSLTDSSIADAAVVGAPLVDVLVARL